MKIARTERKTNLMSLRFIKKSKNGAEMNNCMSALVYHDTSKHLKMNFKFNWISDVCKKHRYYYHIPSGYDSIIVANEK